MEADEQGEVEARTRARQESWTCKAASSTDIGGGGPSSNHLSHPPKPTRLVSQTLSQAGGKKVRIS